MIPEKGKHYDMALITRVDDLHLYSKFYTTFVPIYVGIFDRQIVNGFRDGKTVTDVFIDIGVFKYVNYIYDGTTGYREVLIN